jgi:hypothetical protein
MELGLRPIPTITPRNAAGSGIEVVPGSSPIGKSPLFWSYFRLGGQPGVTFKWTLLAHRAERKAHLLSWSDSLRLALSVGNFSVADYRIRGTPASSGPWRMREDTLSL